MKVLLIIALGATLLGCEQEPEARQFSDDFVENPTDKDWELLIELGEEAEATLSPNELARIKARAFLGAYVTTVENGRGDDFVARVKSRAAKAGSQAQGRADAYLDVAYDTYDATHPTNRGVSYSSQELIEILTIALRRAVVDGDKGAIIVIKGALIHVYSEVRDS